MENRDNIQLTGAEVKVSFTYTDTEGSTVEASETFNPAPEWTALLLRHLNYHRDVTAHGTGAKRVSLQGSLAGDFPQVTEDRWHPRRNFNG